MFVALHLSVFAGSPTHEKFLRRIPTPSDDEVNRIAHQLYCPVCENTPLDVCPTEACRQWRDLIRQQLAKVGLKIRSNSTLLTSTARACWLSHLTGLNWLVYILPPVIILAGAIVSSPLK